MATIQTFKGVVRLTKAQLDTLMNTGSLSDGTTTITYDPETTIYLTPQERASTSEAGVILIATDQDVQTGTNTTKAVTPAQLKTLINELSDTQQDVADNMADISKLQEDVKSGVLPLGVIIPSAISLDQSYLHLLDGSSLLQTGIYAQFCTWLKSKVQENSASVPTCTIAEYATEMTTYGQCGKFVINNTNSGQASNGYSVPANSIKLPTITEFIASNNGGDTIGLAELDMFKSHRHTPAAEIGDWAGNANYNLTFFNDNYGYDYSAYQQNITEGSQGVPSSTGYAGGEETRPKNIRYPYYIVVATAVKTNIEVDIDNVASDINAINSTLNKTEQVEVIYDKDGGSQLDMNHSGGIYGGTWNVFTIDTKYRRVRVYAILNTREVVFEIDLTPIKEGWTTTTSATGLTKNQNLTGNNAYVFYGVLAEIDSGFNFTVRECFSCNVVTDDYAQFQEDTSYYVYRVEGVL